MPCEYDAGEYQVRVVHQAWEQTSNDNPMLVLNITVLARVERREEETFRSPVTERDRRIRMVFTDKTVDYRLEELRRIGWLGTSFADLHPATPNYHDFAGYEFVARCEHRDYKGKPQEEWSVQRGDTAGKPLDLRGLRTLDTLYAKNLAAGARAVPSVAVPSSPAPAAQSAAGPDVGDGPDASGLPF